MTIDTIMSRDVNTGNLIELSGSIISYRIGTRLHWFLIWESADKAGLSIHDIVECRSGASFGSIRNIVGIIGNNGGQRLLSDFDKAYLLIRTVTRQFGGSVVLNNIMDALEILNPKYVRRDK